MPTSSILCVGGTGKCLCAHIVGSPQKHAVWLSTKHLPVVSELVGMVCDITFVLTLPLSCLRSPSFSNERLGTVSSWNPLPFPHQVSGNNDCQQGYEHFGSFSECGENWTSPCHNSLHDTALETPTPWGAAWPESTTGGILLYFYWIQNPTKVWIIIWTRQVFRPAAVFGAYILSPHSPLSPPHFRRTLIKPFV